jgi:hypothetical protein
MGHQNVVSFLGQPIGKQSGLGGFARTFDAF